MNRTELLPDNLILLKSVGKHNDIRMVKVLVGKK